MQKFKVNFAERVNGRAAKNGIKWAYAGKHENWKTFVNERMKYNPEKIRGYRVTDTETGTTIAEFIK